MAFWPQLIGGIEIQERRPKYFNEPRRKRLSFVKSRGPRSGEWALVPARSGHGHFESEQELWDRRQWEANQRFLHQQQQQLLIDHERFRLQHPVPRPELQSWHPERDRGHGQGHDPRIQPLPPPPPGHDHLGNSHHDHHEQHDHHDRHDHHDHDEPRFVEVVTSDSGSDSDDHSYGHGHHRYKVIEPPPKHHLPKYFKPSKRSKSRGRKDKKQKKRPSSLFSSDSSSDDDFAEGFRYGRRMSMERRPLSKRGRSRSRMYELSDDSFEDLDFRRRSRSKSRGHRR